MWGKYYKRFATIFFLIILFQSFAERHKYEELKLTITASSDTVYYSDTLILSIRLKNEGKLPFFINSCMDISTFAKGNSGKECMRITIKHKGKEFYHFSSILFEKKPVKKKYLIYKKRQFKYNYELNFDKLIEKTHADSLFRENYALYFDMARIIDNKEFGQYTFQVEYFNPKTEKITSNVLEIYYMSQ